MVDRTKDISPEQGRLITAEAATWAGTPYRLVGPASTKGLGGDCSGSTWRIYATAGFLFDYVQAIDFPPYAIRSGHFRKLDPGEPRQDGDLLSWQNHMAIFSSFSSSAERPSAINDMWTASHRGGAPYGPAPLRYWHPEMATAYRYQK